MLFNSLEFLIFFPIVVLLYYVIPQKWNKIWLLATSYFFYLCWSIPYVLVLLFVTVSSWCFGQLLQRKKSKAALSMGIIVVVASLLLFKYADFVLLNVNSLLGKTGISYRTPLFSLALPVGISFYTLQALSYLIDIYKGKINSEKNILHYALYISFFPTVVSGPIQKAGIFLSQVLTPKKFEYEKVRNGLIQMTWGFFLKIVIADRIAILVNRVYDDYSAYSGSILIVATICYGIQLYCDFAGYSYLAMGIAKALGYQVCENFKQPYLAVSVKDFWRRWHISLSSWLRDYIYIPLGGSRVSKGRKYLNLMITFLISGLWHGASWGYVFWGFLHGFYQVVGEVTAPIRDRIRGMLHITADGKGYGIFRRIFVFALIDYAWLYFRAPSLRAGFEMTRQMLQHLWISNLYDGSLTQLGLDDLQLMVVGIAIIIAFVVDILHEKEIPIDNHIRKMSLPQRWSLYFVAGCWLLITVIQNVGGKASVFLYSKF